MLHLGDDENRFDRPRVDAITDQRDHAVEAPGTSGAARDRWRPSRREALRSALVHGEPLDVEVEDGGEAFECIDVAGNHIDSAGVG